MSIKLWISLAIASNMIFGIAACSSTTTDSTTPAASLSSEEAAVDPCAAADPCAAVGSRTADPCAADPCAGGVISTNFNLDNGVAIEGTDPVAYFTDGAVVPGTADYAYEWSGAVWHFSSDEHRELFAANPEAYVPQYGGYCAWAVSQGYTAPIDPNAWKIVDGKLYLNYDKKVQARWEKDIPGNIAQANENWPGLQS